MNEWVEDEQRDGWMDRRRDGWTDGKRRGPKTKGKIDRWKDGQKEGGMGRGRRVDASGLDWTLVNALSDRRTEERTASVLRPTRKRKIKSADPGYGIGVLTSDSGDRPSQTN